MTTKHLCLAVHLGLILLTAIAVTSCGKNKENSDVPAAIKAEPRSPEIKACIPKVEDPLFLDPSPPASLNAVDQKKWQELLAHAPRLTQRKYFYRWGDPTYEVPRIGKDPIFEVSPVKNDVNFGRQTATATAAQNAAAAAVAGPGLYLADKPLASQNYASATNKLYTVSVAGNTPWIDYSDPDVIRNISAFGITQNDIAWFKTDPGIPILNEHVLPILHSYNWNVLFQVRLRAGKLAPFMTAKAFVLKTPIGAKYEEEFTGKELPTRELIETISIADLATVKLAPLTAGAGGKPNVREYYLDRIKGTLSKRIYDPSGLHQETVPTPVTQLHERATWSTVPALAHCDSSPPQGKSSYFWRYDGSCGEYSEYEHDLVHDNVDKSHCYNSWPPSSVVRYSHCRKGGRAGPCYKTLVVDTNLFIIVDAASAGSCTPFSPNCEENAGVVP